MKTRINRRNRKNKSRQPSSQKLIETDKEKKGWVDIYIFEVV